MDLWECALGFMDSQVLMTAEKLGVFNALADGADSPGGVARATGMPEDSVGRLLVALCALGIVEKTEDGRYVNGPEADDKLVEGRPGYVGSMFKHVREDLYPLWAHFEDALREGEAQWERAFGDGEDGDGTPRNEEVFEKPESLRAFMDGMHAITYPAAEEFASDAAELDEIETIVDLGGASGAFLIALARRAPHLRGTVFDLPQVQPIAEDFFRRYEVDDRLDFHAGDFFSEPLPEADAYSLGFVLHDWETEQGTRLLEKVSGAVRPGGILIIGEYLLDDDKTGPLFVARSDLNMLVAARGRERSAQEYGEWIEPFGFEIERVRLTSNGKNFMVARQR